MNIVGSLTAHSNNPKGNSPTTGRKDKINSLKINIIMDNTVKIRKNDDFNFLDSEDNPRRGDKRGRRLYDKKNNNKNKKIRVAKLNKYHEEREKLEP